MKFAFRACGYLVEFGKGLHAWFDDEARAMNFATTHDRGGAVIEHGMVKTLYERVEVDDDAVTIKAVS